MCIVADTRPVVSGCLAFPGAVDAAHSTLGAPTGLPFYPLGTVVLTVSLIDQFNAPYALCDAAAWATEAHSYHAWVAGPSAANVTARLACAEGGGIYDVVAIVEAGPEAQEGTLDVNIEMDSPDGATQVAIGASPVQLTLSEGLRGAGLHWVYRIGRVRKCAPRGRRSG